MRCGGYQMNFSGGRAANDPLVRIFVMGPDHALDPAPHLIRGVVHEMSGGENPEPVLRGTARGTHRVRARRALHLRPCRARANSGQCDGKPDQRRTLKESATLLGSLRKAILRGTIVCHIEYCATNTRSGPVSGR